MDSTVLDVDTSHSRLVDLTSSAASFVRGRGDGLLSVFVPHATAGVAIFETGAGSEEDVLELLDRVLPADDRYVHLEPFGERLVGGLGGRLDPEGARLGHRWSFVRSPAEGNAACSDAYE